MKSCERGRDRGAQEHQGQGPHQSGDGRIAPDPALQQVERRVPAGKDRFVA